LDAELGCDRSQPHGAWRLRRSLVESVRADNANWRIFGHHDHEWLLVGNDMQGSHFNARTPAAMAYGAAAFSANPAFWVVAQYSCCLAHH
jgi:hypothetical protein